jgi:hypothetical protein
MSFTTTIPYDLSLFDTFLAELITTALEPPLTVPKLAVATYPYFELKNYLYSLYQSLTKQDNFKVSDIAVDNFFRGRDTIISIDKTKLGFNLRISSSKEGIASWHKNNWCSNGNKIAYVVLDALDLEPFTTAVEKLIEEVERYEF